MKVIGPWTLVEILRLMQKRTYTEFLFQDLLEAGIGHGVS